MVRLHLGCKRQRMVQIAIERIRSKFNPTIQTKRS